MIDRRRMLAGAVALASRAAPVLAAPSGASRDLQGLWTLASFTDLERPAALHALVLTPAEAEAYEAPRRALHGFPPSKADDVGQAETDNNERGEGLARVGGEIRSSWIVDPPDGHIPYSNDAKLRLGRLLVARSRFENPEALNGAERCLANNAAGAPMVGAADTNLFQIVQTPEAVVIVTEKYHDVRIVRLGADGPPAAPFSAWLGESSGRWEGDTLVVETGQRRPGLIYRGNGLWASGETRVVERFTRAGPAELRYAFTVEDPSLFSRSWRGEMSLHPAKGRMYEYACHEGNYSLPAILRGARAAEAKPAP